MSHTADDLIRLLKPHYNSAAQYCHALFQDSNDAQDGLQDAIITALEKLHTLKDPERFRSWFFTIITRTFYSARRKEKKKQQLYAVLITAQQGFPTVFDDGSASAREIALMAALNTLSPKERAAILLFELGGFSQEEIRQIQGESSLSAIKSRLSRTREKLRNAITLIEKETETGGYYDRKNGISGR